MRQRWKITDVQPRTQDTTHNYTDVLYWWHTSTEHLHLRRIYMRENTHRHQHANTRWKGGEHTFTTGGDTEWNTTSYFVWDFFSIERNTYHNQYFFWSCFFSRNSIHTISILYFFFWWGNDNENIHKPKFLFRS